MAAEFDWLTRAMPNLTPEQLAAILSGQVSADTGGNMPMRSAGGFTQQGTYRSTNSGDAEYIDRTPGGAVWDNSVINGPNLNDTNYFAQYDPQGRFIGYAEGTDDSSWKDFLTAAAIILGGYYGGTYLNGAYGGAPAGAATGTASGVGGGVGVGGGTGGSAATGAASGAAGASSITLPTTAEMAAGMTPATASSAAGAMPAINTAAAAGGTAAGTSAATKAGTAAATSAATQGGGQSSTSGVSDFRQGEIGSYQSDPNAVTKAATTDGNMSDFDRWWEGVKQSAGTGAGNDPKTAGYWDMASKLLTGGGGWGDVVGGLLGAYAGYQGSKDKENTTRTEPWGPAQPYLQGLLQKGAGLYDRFEATPFSDAERAAYSNQGNVLDYINANAPGLMSGFDATAAGRNQFSRDNPRRGLIGNSYDAATSPVAWRPSLLGDFGTTTAAVRRR